MINKTLTELRKALENKSISSVELTQIYLNRIKQFDHSINSFITITDKLALEQALASDQARAKGNRLPALAGIPIAHKDIFCTQGIKTTCGSKMLDNFIAPYNATLIERFNSAGTVMLGKTNMDEFAMGSSNENSFYGPCLNPWDQTKVPGGSSGGSAAAVAAGFAPASTGTDTGGSIRQPAAFCGLTGLKPTYGAVSRYGMIAYASSLDQAGPIAQTAEDAALLMNIMAGFDDKDSTSSPLEQADFTAKLSAPLKDKTIGLPSAYFSDQLDSEIACLLEEAIKTYEKMGASFKTIELSTSDLAISAYYIIAPCEASANLQRYDGVRYGYRCQSPQNLDELYTRSRQEGFGDEVKRRIMMGTYALSSGFYDAYYLKAQKIRRLIKEDFDKAFAEVDFILGPTAPSPAFALGENKQDPVAMYLEDIFTISANLAGLPAISLPCGFKNNLPVGMQLIGPAFTEANILNLAHQYQQQTDWHLQRAELSGAGE